jgi:hypothetical protein
MLMTKERRRAIRTLRGWAISVLQEANAIRECETHGWMQDRADPHARERAFEIASRDPPDGNRGLIGLDRGHLPRMPAGQLVTGASRPAPATSALEGNAALAPRIRMINR